MKTALCLALAATASFLFVSPVWATAACDSGCEPTPQLLSPPPDSRVPLNARILVNEAYTVLEDREGNIIETTLEVAGDRLVWLTPVADLAPSTEYRVRSAESETSGTEWFTTWTFADTEPPQDVEINFDKSYLSCGSIASLGFRASADNESWIIVEIQSATRNEDTLFASGRSGFHTSDCLLGADESNPLTIVVYDLAGNASEPIKFTLESEGDCLCQAVTAADRRPRETTALGLGFAVVGLLGLRHRSNRPADA